jgi:hypothetical protein
MWFENRKEMGNRRINLIIGIFLLIFVFVAFYLLMRFGGWDQCEESKSIKEMSIKGVVTKKILDEENKYQQLIQIMDSDKIKTLNLSNEILKLKKTGNSITWERLSKNDSILKKVGTFEIHYKNKDCLSLSVK